MTDGAGFRQFGEATRLYADNAAVVEQIRHAFLDDVNLFLDVLRLRVQSLLSVPVRESRADRTFTRRWWLSDDDSDHREHLVVWMWTHETKIVRPGVLDVSPWIYDNYTDFFKPFRHQIVALKDRLDLPPSCKIKKGVEGIPFTVSIVYGEADPVEVTAGPIAELLTRLYEVERKLRTPKP